MKSPSATIEEFLAVKLQVEQFLSLVCVGRLVAREVAISEMFPPARLLWQLGGETEAEPTERMPHQVLVFLDSIRT